MMDRQKIILLMTATITPRNCPDAQFQPDERRKRYLKSFTFYLRELGKGVIDGIVFAENSESSLDDFKATIPLHLSDRVEFVAAPTEIFLEHLQKNNEFILIDYAVDHSRLLRTDVSGFFKVTGRYYFRNVKSLIADVRQAMRAEKQSLNLFCDQRDHRLYSWIGLKCKERDGDTRYFFSSVEFWRDNFYGYFVRKPEWRRVEDIMFEVAESHYGDSTCRFRYRHQPLIGGNQYATGQGQKIKCMGLMMPPRVFFAIYYFRWLIETIIRKCIPSFWF